MSRLGLVVAGAFEMTAKEGSGHATGMRVFFCVLTAAGSLSVGTGWAADDGVFANRFFFGQSQTSSATSYSSYSAMSFSGADTALSAAGSPFGSGAYAGQGTAAAAATAFAMAKNSATNYLFPALGQSAPDWAKRVEFQVDVQQNLKPTYSLLTVQPLYQDANKQNTVFVQLSQERYDMVGKYRDTTNAGLGYRRLLMDNQVLVGANAFYDYEWTYHHQRAGLGGEVKWAMLDFNANWYKAVSSEKSIDVTAGITERAMSGFDVEVRSQVPFLPWLQVGAQHYRWNSDYADDTKGWQYSASADITPNISVETGWRRDNYNSSSGFAKVALHLARTDRPAMLSDKFVSDKAFEQRDMRAYTLDKVRRENRIMVERKTTTSTGSIIIARGT